MLFHCCLINKPKFGFISIAFYTRTNGARTMNGCSRCTGLSVQRFFLHLHRNSISLIVLETARSRYAFMQVGITRQGIYAALEPSGLQLPLRGDLVQSFNHEDLYLFLYLSRTGRRQDPILYLSICKSPVFLINSRHSSFSALVNF